LKLPVLTCKVIESYLSSLDTPRSLAIWLMFVNNEHQQLVSVECSPKDYIDPEAFRLDYLATKFLSKATFLSTNIDLRATALDKFEDAEQACGLINRRGFAPLIVKQSVGEWLHHAIIRKIDAVLGDFDPDEWVDLSNWGPGSTLDIKGIDTSSVKKFRCENGTTRALYNLMKEFYVLLYPSWDLSNQKIFDGNKIVTVPKNSKTDRTIAIEPGLNIWFQLGVGKMIRRRLRRVGIDLNSQERNQQLAKRGSLDNSLATVDFASASDTISYATVESLLPPRWFEVLRRLRSVFGSLGGKSIQYEKFSSMGNGFTFELETLIFYSIASACCEILHEDRTSISVYGDDVIIPVGAYTLFCETCKFYGFTVNAQKSFSSGPFRESCGTYWFNGLDCKPFFLRELVQGQLEKYKVANGIRRTSHRPGFYPFCDVRFKPTVDLLIENSSKKLFISEGFGDGGFIGNFDEAVPSRAKHGIEGYHALALVAIPLGYESDHHSVLLARLRDRSVEMDFGNLVHFRRQVRISRKRILIRQWYNLGPWY